MRKCRGQAYYGTRTLYGAYRRNEKLEERAKYIRCGEHVSLAGVPVVSSFFDILDCLFQLFNASVRVWSVHQDEGTDVPS